MRDGIVFMIPKMDPKQMATLMKQMGIKNEEIPAERVVIEKTDGSKLIVENPNVMLVDMQGQKSFQITGEITEEESAKTEDDADLIMKECGCSRENAEKALADANGDLAEAILKLKGEN